MTRMDSVRLPSGDDRVAASKVREAIRRFEAARLSWPPDDVTDAILEACRLPDPSWVADGLRRLAEARLRRRAPRTQSAGP